jgi:hypothetical protein
MKRRILIFLLIMVLGMPVALALAQAGSYAVTWSTIAGGGGISGAGTFAIHGTSGQAALGQMSDGTYSLTGGFWASDMGVYRSYLPIILKLA